MKTERTISKKLNQTERKQTMITSQNNQAQVESKTIDNRIIEVPVENLSIPVSHPRRRQGDMETLEKSIRQNGLLEPLTVCKSEDGQQYMVVDGTRRLTVIMGFGWKSVPCIALDSMPLGQIAHFSFEKNMERKSLDPIEIALHLKSMQEKYGYSMRELETLGYGSTTAISQKIKLLDLPDAVKKSIENGELAVSHGLALCKLENAKHQEKMAKQAMDYEWSAKTLERNVENFLAKGKTTPKEKVKVPEGDIPGVYFKDANDMSELPNKSVHLCVTSPPYCVGMEFEKGISYDDHWENMQEVMAEVARTLVPGGVLALNVGDIHNFKGAKGNNKIPQIQLVGHKYQSFLRQHQVYLTDQIVWVKRMFPHSQDKSRVLTDKTRHTAYRIVLNHEPVYIFRKKGEREVPSEEIALNSRISKKEWNHYASSVWMIDHVRRMDGHPAIFPEELVRRLVNMFSYEGDTVLDPFLGSGTTVKVARELNREGIGYEREIQYKSVIMEKLGVEGTSPVVGSMVEYSKKIDSATKPREAKEEPVHLIENEELFAERIQAAMPV